MDENVAHMISDILSDNVARTPLWGSWSIVNFGDRDVALKSGSTNNLRDAWIMGYAPNIAVGAWVGNNDNSIMGGGLSGLITTPMWREFMDIALEKLPNESFLQPQINTAGVKPILRGEYIDTSLLLQAMQNSNSSSSISIADVYNNVHSILHFVDKNNPNGGYPANPTSDGQYINWEYGVQKWNEETFGALFKAQQLVTGQEEEIKDVGVDNNNSNRTNRSSRNND
jgi:penicillin-binding protein 1A